MLLQRPEGGYGQGYTTITEENGRHRDMLMDFGILRLSAGNSYRNSDGKERAYLLMNGEVNFQWSSPSGESGNAEAKRSDLLDEEPVVLHVPENTEVIINAVSDLEIAVQGISNPRSFPVRLWKGGDYPSARFGEGTLQDTSTRIVRTIFDASNAPESAMVMGEVINYPGKWSSFPPHDHPQPEVYHFRMFPSQGFGFSAQGDEAFIVRNEDTVTIPPDVVHPQTAAPGYAMYYIWLIPHLPGNKFGPDSRCFRKEHEWCLDSEAPIWPDADLKTILDYQNQEESNS